MEKGIKNLSKVYAKSMQEKGMQKVWKIMTKGSENGSRNPSKIGKVMEKRHAENDVEIWSRKKSRKVAESIDPGDAKVEYLSVPGEGGKLKPANTGWLYSVWHARHPGGVRRMEMMPKWNPNGGQNRLKIWKYAKKGMPKIDAKIWCWKKCAWLFSLSILDWFSERFRGVWGVAEFKLRLQADFKL